MRLLKSAIFVAGALAATSSFAEVKTGLEADLSITSVSGDGTDSAKSDIGIHVNKADFLTSFSSESKKTTAMIQTDLLQLAGVAGGAASTSLFDDAWVQFSFNDMINVKGGIEETFSKRFGKWSDVGFNTYNEIDARNVKLELNGKASGVSYGLQTWEDEAANMAADDVDTGLFTNMALRASYAMDMFEAGFIYTTDQGVANGEKNADANVSAYTVHGQYWMKDLGLSLFGKYMGTMAKDMKGGTNLIVGAEYAVDQTMAVKASYEQVNAQYADGADAPDAGSMMQLFLSKDLDTNYTAYFHYLTKDKNLVGGDKAVSTIALGALSKF